MNKVFMAVIASFSLAFASCDKPRDDREDKPKEIKTTEEIKKMSSTTEENIFKDLKIETPKEGSGPIAGKGDLILVQYTGKLLDGKVFDSNADTNTRQPLAVILGQGRMIKGFEKGLEGVKNGEERKITIPYALAYGEEGRPPTIPAKSDLIFEVKILDLVKKDDQSKFTKNDVKVGTGKEAVAGKSVKVHYTGKLVNGKKFDSSKDRNEPFEFKLGAGQVIKGWDEGVAGMRVGGTRILHLPPAFAYGEHGAGGSIGPNQVLDFEVELLDVK